MKTLTCWLPIVFALMLPVTASAAIVDTFRCTVKVIDTAYGESSDTEQDLQIARLPVDSQSNYEVTIAHQDLAIRLNNDRGESFSAILSISYRHAFQRDLNGGILQARQNSCIGLRGIFSDRQGDSASSFPCSVASDPFTDHSNWRAVRFDGNLPAFDENALDLYSIAIHDYKGATVATAAASCKLISTSK